MAVPEKLAAASEPKVIALSYDVPLSPMEATMLDGFEKTSFYRDRLAEYGRRSKPLPDNKRTTPAEVELARTETEGRVTRYYQGRTGVLNAVSINGLVPQQANTLERDISDISNSLADEVRAGAPARKGRTR